MSRRPGWRWRRWATGQPCSGSDLTAVGGELRFRVLGLGVDIELSADDSGGMRMRCAVPADGEEVVKVPVAGVQRTLADVAGYLSALGDLSVAADGGDAARVPGFGGWLSTQRT